MKVFLVPSYNAVLYFELYFDKIIVKSNHQRTLNVVSANIHFCCCPVKKRGDIYITETCRHYLDFISAFLLSSSASCAFAPMSNEP